MGKLEVFWRGRIPLENVSWTLSPDSEITLAPELEVEREIVWRNTLKKYSDSYDGHLVVLIDYTISRKSINFQLGSITFSRILTLDKAGVKPDAYGSLGFQAILYSSDRKYVLVGERSKDSLYCPFYYALPGGMLEVADTRGSFEQACMREIREEASLELGHQKYLVALVGELHGNVGVAAIIEAFAKESIDHESSILGNEEWTGKRIQWVFVDEFTVDNSLEGLMFLKNERQLLKST